jgi:hypothetical protein
MGIRQFRRSRGIGKYALKNGGSTQQSPPMGETPMQPHV